MNAFFERIAAFREKLPLSPAERAVSGFVLCAFAASLAVRGWSALAAPPPVPAVFRELDSVFAARSHGAVPERVLWTADGPARKTFPAPHSINLNTAPPEYLRRIPGIGPAIAARIVAFRSATPFRSAEEIMRVPGIGKRTWERIRIYIVAP